MDLVAVRWWRIKDVLICRNGESRWIRDCRWTSIYVKMDSLVVWAHVLLLDSHGLCNWVTIWRNAEISSYFLWLILRSSIKQERGLVARSHLLLLKNVGLLKLEVQIARSRVVRPCTNAMHITTHWLILLMLLSQAESFGPWRSWCALQSLMLLLLSKFDFLILVLKCWDCSLHLLDLLRVLSWDVLSTGNFWGNIHNLVIFGLWNSLPM